MIPESEITETRPEKKTRTLPVSARVFAFFIGALILFRLAYDLSLYFFGGTFAVCTGKTYDYLIRLPKGYTDFGGPRPLLIFLHGAGQIGCRVGDLKEFDPFHFAQGRVPAEELPFILIDPVLPEGYQWQPAEIQKLVESLLRHHGRLRIDPKRLYLTGYSMGGFGTFCAAEECPNLFAAIAPLAGGGDLTCAGRLKNIPIRAFHGDADEIIPYKCSAEMIETVKKAGNLDAELITLPGEGHNICPEVYSRPEIYRWLLDQEK